jgi:hypothetical protein
LWNGNEGALIGKSDRGRCDIVDAVALLIGTAARSTDGRARFQFRLGD